MKQTVVLLLLALLAATASSQVTPQSCLSVVDYRIAATLNPSEQTVQGKMTLRWIHTGSQPVSELYFHAYPNAFKNASSHFFRDEARWQPDGKALIDILPAEELGYMEIHSCILRRHGSSESTDLLPSLDYRAPGVEPDGDQTVFVLELPQPVSPGATIDVNMDFTTKLPKSILRSGYHNRTFFVSQWYPKIGFLEADAWHCRPYHRDGEFFGNFGSFTVELIVPDDLTVAATGVLVDSVSSDGITRYTYQQDCVHDFAWTAGADYQVMRRQFTFNELPSVELILLVQSANRSLADRIFQATENALKYYGLWTVPYPYPTLTIVDAPWRSQIGGMEYPTLFTIEVTENNIGTLDLESLIVHECGHQFWYGMVANDEGRFPWLDEGLNSYSESRVMNAAYGPRTWRHTVLKKSGFGISFDLADVRFAPRLQQWQSFLPANGRDIIDQPADRFIDHSSYMKNSYSKAALVFWTLEGVIGEEIFTEIIKTFSQRYQFAHPKPKDIFDIVREKSPIELDHFLEQAFRSGARCDYAVAEVTSRTPLGEKGFYGSGKDRILKTEKTADESFINRVVLQRKGELTLPVDIEISLENGEILRQTWDGKELWHRIEWSSSVAIQKVEIDPERKIMLDANLSNNARYRKSDSSAALKWSGLWMGWLQHLFEVMAFFS
ncbi:M1 family metallopeptidase [candidate division KSB1 bacterium]|nr:M1 family metallopeptidase [candidate division KSB1 bacterium]